MEISLGNNDDTWHPQTADLNKEVAVSSETLVTSRTEIGEIKRTLQTLEIKLQAQLSKVTVSNTSAYTDCLYTQQHTDA